MARLPTLLAGLLLLTMLLFSAPVGAVGLIRDAGVEYALDKLARPVLTAAGLPARRTRVLIVNDLSMNAFVVDSRTIFIHAGLLLRLSSAAELQAVIAHEAAHISNGHFARRGMNAEAARRNALIGLAAGVAAGAASGNPGAGIGIALGSQSSALGVFLGHTREEEAAADRSGMRYLAIAGVDPTALRSVMDIFVGQEAITPERRDAYARSHPLSRERLRAIDQAIETLRPAPGAEADGDVAYWFDRARAKLSAYLREPSHTFARWPDSDTGDPARIARAVAHTKNSNLAGARRELAALLEVHPDDAFLHELQGWIEMEMRQIGSATDAYARAVELAPRDPLILAGYGRALLAQNTPASNASALEVLEDARARDSRNAGLLRDLSVAYARAGNNGLASLATAERYALAGDIDDAAIHAHRAAGQLPTGSPGWARAQDVIRAAETSKRR